MLTISGLRHSRLRDGAVHVAHRPDAVQGEACTLHFHLGESAGSEITIWHEGEQMMFSKQGTFSCVYR